MAAIAYRGCIYLATNTANGSIYIGKSIMGVARRRKTHFAAVRAGAKQPFICALRKYGPDSFRWEEIYLSNDHDALVAAEIALIAAYKQDGFRLYNATAGGDGARRKRPPAEVAAIKERTKTVDWSAMAKSAWTPERRAKHAEYMRNRFVSGESRARMSAARKGMRFTPEHCEAIRLSKLGNTYRRGTGRRVKLPQP